MLSTRNYLKEDLLSLIARREMCYLLFIERRILIWIFSAMSPQIKEGQISLSSTFTLTLADYGIAFADGKPSTNIAKEIEITAVATY